MSFEVCGRFSHAETQVPHLYQNTVAAGNLRLLKERISGRFTQPWGYTHVIGDDHRKVAEQLGEFFAQVRLNLPKYKNGSGDGSSQADEV
jgi:hypothetical protein